MRKGNFLFNIGVDLYLVACVGLALLFCLTAPQIKQVDVVERRAVTAGESSTLPLLVPYYLLASQGALQQT